MAGPRGRKRRKAVLLYFSDDEMDALASRMAEAGQPVRSRFLRRMALEGRAVGIDPAPVAELVFLVRGAANNVNQLAKKANMSGRVAARDVSELRRQVAELKRSAEAALGLLSAAIGD